MVRIQNNTLEGRNGRKRALAEESIEVRAGEEL